MCDVSYFMHFIYVFNVVSMCAQCHAFACCYAEREGEVHQIVCLCDRCFLSLVFCFLARLVFYFIPDPLDLDINTHGGFADGGMAIEPAPATAPAPAPAPAARASVC